MNIKSQINKSRSKENACSIARYIGNNSNLFAELIEILLGNNNQLALRASMVLGKCTDQYPDLIIPHLPELLDCLNKDVIDGVKRSIVRGIQEINIPEAHLGIATDILFKLISDYNQPIAIKVFTMTSLYHICVREPLLSQELKHIIEDQMSFESTGFKNRGAKTVQMLNLLISQQ